MNKENIIIGGIISLAFIIIIITFFYKNDELIMYNTNDEIENLNSQIKKRDSLTSLLTYKLDSLTQINTKLKIQNDSLYIAKQQISKKYYEIYISINTANNKQLDSLLRANW